MSGEVKLIWFHLGLANVQHAQLASFGNTEAVFMIRMMLTLISVLLKKKKITKVRLSYLIYEKDLE